MNQNNESVNNEGKWNVGQPGGPTGPFYSVFKPNGNVVAMQIVSKEMAEHIATIPIYQNVAQAANQLSNAIAEFDVDPAAIGESLQALDYWLAKLGYSIP